ncbi:AraC family transcriptional regulator [Paenibacillus luteus]|uniref:AraC family transcriptional regulator n=1 Tax=Paenibacillus luteus TaxID=2545753 RepID=UPI001589B5FC|nr:effector binding domain-containing protein [Paenibacillus luteus]
MEWLLRMKEAIDLMEKKMEEPLNIEEIAKAACASPFHFQRMFLMLTGVTVAEYMRKRKLTLAAQELAMSPVKVIDVAQKYGYDSPESFAKAFRKIHGISPSEARNPGNSLKAFPRIAFQLSLKGDKDMDYRILKKEAFTVVGKSFRLSCEDNQQMREIPKLWQQAHQDGTIAKLGAIAAEGDLLGIIANMQPGGNEFDYWIAGESDAASGTESFDRTVIPASTWAIFTSIGPMPGAIQSVFERIYQEWFPATGYEHAGTAEMELYPEGDTTAEDYRCEIWIPVVKN